LHRPHVSPHRRLALFFLHCYRTPRAPHSFPTRRSSDLGELLRERLHGFDQRPAQLGDVDRGGELVRERVDRDHVFPPVHLALVVDRKSTRLNSSHVSISYAVFCLKKKKKLMIYVSAI